jgi:hypothetical protein
MNTKSFLKTAVCGQWLLADFDQSPGVGDEQLTPVDPHQPIGLEIGQNPGKGFRLHSQPGCNQALGQRQLNFPTF